MSEVRFSPHKTVRSQKRLRSPQLHLNKLVILFQLEFFADALPAPSRHGQGQIWLGDKTVVTGANSRAEVQLDWANLIRLSSNAEVRLAELENQRYTLQVARGLVTFRVLRESDADVEISTPSVSVRPTGIGTYRIEVREDGDSEITVRSGSAVSRPTRSPGRLRAGAAVP